MAEWEIGSVDGRKEGSVRKEVKRGSGAGGAWGYDLGDGDDVGDVGRELGFGDPEGQVDCDTSDSGEGEES